ncbi:MFS transporter [Candidatus Kuenenbacteria bacterium]|nr:MFS transporter [Candidatus Kuenenbacteria bacterium]
MSLFKSKNWGSLWPAYATFFFGSIIPQVSAIFVVLWAARGFSFFQISLGFVVMRAAMFIFEIPTGVIADLYSKKVSTLMHYLLSGIIYICLFFTHSFVLFLVLFAFEGISKTLSSGAAEALEYEQCHDDEQLAKKYYRTKEVIMKVGETIGDALTVGFLLLIGANSIYRFWNFEFRGMDLLYLTGALGYFISLVFYSCMKEQKNSRIEAGENYLSEAWVQFKTTISYLKNSQHIMWLFLFMVVAAEGLSFWEPVNQAFLLDRNFSPEYIAAVIAITGLISSFFVYIPRKMERFFSHEIGYAFFVLVAHIIITVCAWIVVSPLIAIIFFVVKSNFATVLNPIMRPYFQHHIPNKIRATMLSAESVAAAILVVGISPVEGYLLDRFGVNIAVTFPIIFVLIALFILIQMKRQSNLEKNIE